MDRLILFDIDGTLTRTQNGFIPFNQAILDTFGIAGDIRSIFPDGRTDPHILEDIFSKSKTEVVISDEHLTQFGINLVNNYTAALRAKKTSVHALPGVQALLSRLARFDECALGVVTGNFQVTAQIKLGEAGLDRHLSFGAYASDSRHRPDLPAIAKGRWEKSAGRSVLCEGCVIIGDTPFDLEAARANGMRCLLVGTGRYPLEELEYYAPDACVADLTETERIIDVLLHL